MAKIEKYFLFNRFEFQYQRCAVFGSIIWWRLGSKVNNECPLLFMRGKLIFYGRTIDYWIWKKIYTKFKNHCSYTEYHAYFRKTIKW